MDLSTLSRARLQRMAEAAREVRLCQRILAKTGDSVVGELLRGQGTIYEWRHYPPGDVYDNEYHAQYYYHCHPLVERPPGEHGHFHTFLRPLGMPGGIHPAPVPDLDVDADSNDALSHLIGIGMDNAGQAVRLFTTNRWVTGETWYSAADVIQMLDHFAVDHARPSWPANRWVTAMLVLFRPSIETLLWQRDAAIIRREAENPDHNVLEDRSLEVISQAEIDIESQIVSVSRALRRAELAASRDIEAGVMDQAVQAPTA